jgi:hypothetical protein
MDTYRIDRLIQKYEKGETSLEEEKEIRIFFSGENIPSHLTEYKAIFEYYSEEGNDCLSDQNFESRLLDKISQDHSPKIRYINSKKAFSYLGIAATILLLFGVWFMYDANDGSKKVDQQDAETAYLEAKQILITVSQNLNDGLYEFSAMSEFDNGIKELNKLKSFDEGLRSLEKISVLNSSQNIVSQINKKNENTNL